MLHRISCSRLFRILHSLPISHYSVMFIISFHWSVTTDNVSRLCFKRALKQNMPSITVMKLVRFNAVYASLTRKPIRWQNNTYLLTYLESAYGIADEKVSRWSWKATCCWVQPSLSQRTLSSSCTPPTASTETSSPFDSSTSTWRLSWTHTATRPCREKRTSTSTPFRNRSAGHLLLCRLHRDLPFLRATPGTAIACLSHRNSVGPFVCLSVRLSVTRVDQSKTVQARITKSSRRLLGRLWFQDS